MLLAACTHPEQVKNPASEGPVISTELSNQKVTCVCEDAQGQIWIGTFRGLNRYNSHEYHQYFCHDDSVSLPDNQIQDLMLDSKGRLWVSTVNGVARYTDQDQFEQIPIEGPNGNGVQLLELKNGRILLNMVVHLQDIILRRTPSRWFTPGLTLINHTPDSVMWMPRGTYGT